MLFGTTVDKNYVAVHLVMRLGILEALRLSMDKFATLEPVKLYSSHNNKTLSLPPPLVGRLPSELHLVILRYLPIPDFFHPTPGAPTPPPHSLNPTSSGKNATMP